MEQLFLAASRSKLRFSTTKGLLTTEDLWDLSLISLDAIAKGVNKQLKDSQEESFITKPSAGNSELELKLEILKFIISAKQDEAKAKANKNAKAQEVALLKELLADKKLDTLKSMTPEQITARLAELEGQS